MLGLDLASVITSATTVAGKFTSEAGIAVAFIFGVTMVTVAIRILKRARG